MHSVFCAIGFDGMLYPYCLFKGSMGRLFCQFLMDRWMVRLCVCGILVSSKGTGLSSYRTGLSTKYKHIFLQNEHAQASKH